MMTPSRSATVALLGMAVLLLPLHAPQAEGSLLWKATNLTPATVVPPYTNQTSPFPVTAPPKVEVDENAVTEALAEQKRLRDEAYKRADQMIRSGAGFEPVLRGLRVGGMLEGNLGKRVLLGNQWVGMGSQVRVRQTRTRELIEALRALQTYDTDMAVAMADHVDKLLRTNSTVTLSVKAISEKALTLAAPSGKTYDMNFTNNNN